MFKKCRRAQVTLTQGWQHTNSQVCGAHIALCFIFKLHIVTYVVCLCLHASNVMEQHLELLQKFGVLLKYFSFMAHVQILMKFTELTCSYM